MPSLNQHFKGVIGNGFDGACPPMKCAFHPKRIVSSHIWRSIVDDASFLIVERNAPTPLSLCSAEDAIRGKSSGSRTLYRVFWSLIVSPATAILLYFSFQLLQEGPATLSSLQAKRRDPPSELEAFDSVRGAQAAKEWPDNALGLPKPTG